ncbi:uncharacterized protein (DUF1330 family) [Silvibacterium bohemicum]|uniref:Uncharacterized protein (DUF1330 family) n=1 Tax=Silvibacterium bohemicum TaxID=1577686 RepID=A0A841K587_9BACT|nr:DUF1330 domain-containing protein [Silvibacterium bohemicum]MBB6145768.1 uncharacterized protein (DUF1330 family) [Silvibacterium bohemicum]
MSAYLIFTRDKTLDEQEMAIYSKEAAATLAGHEAKPLALYGAHEDLEGPPTEGAVIMQFPSMEAAKAWYDGPAYRKVREHRFKGAAYRVVLIQGV